MYHKKIVHLTTIFHYFQEFCDCFKQFLWMKQ